jgi:HSP20 family protein
MREWMPSLAASPAIDLIERDGGFELSVELPGLGPDDVEIRMTENTLTVKAEKSEETKDEEGEYHVSERRYGTILRSIRLPDGIDTEKVEAKFDNGVLKVSLPKSAKAKASERRIEVTAA